MNGFHLLPPSAVGVDPSARNVRLLSIMRGLAIGGQFAAILIAATLLGIRLPLVPMLAALTALLVQIGRAHV